MYMIEKVRFFNRTKQIKIVDLTSYILYLTSKQNEDI